MLWLVPHLYADPRLLDALARRLHAPGLATLLARGVPVPGPDEGVEAALCEALGIVRQQDWPLAPITLRADGGDAGDAYWLRADPVALQLMRDRVVLTDPGALALTPEEARLLATAIGEHFGTDFHPLPLHPHRWYLRCPQPPDLTTTPLSVASGRAIAPLLPRGADAGAFRARLNELQMLLHAHPLNAAREARGLAPINSVWLWGGGVGQQPAAAARTIYAADAEVLALARAAGAASHVLPPRLEGTLLAGSGVILLDTLTPAGLQGDAAGWRQALDVLERDWFAPLAAALHKLGPEGLRLIDPVSGRGLTLRRADAWKLWRRPRKLASMLAGQGEAGRAGGSSGTMLG